MKSRITPILLLSVLIVGSGSMAFADCESDMIQLEDALKTPNLTPDAKAALDAAVTTSVAAMRKDDDTTCHQAISDALAKAGIPMK